MAGGAAFAANRFLQDQYGAGYPGIYYLSQQVAQSGLNAIKASAQNDGTGKIDDTTFFNSAAAAWATNGVSNLFPGNLYGLFTLDWSQIVSPGAAAAFAATAYASDVGKTTANFSPGQIITLPDGSSAAVDGNGHIQAVFATTSADILVALGYSLHVAEGSPNPPDPAVTTYLLGGQTPVAFTETNTSTYNGDVNPQITNTNLSAQVYGARTAGTDQSDLIFAQAGADGGLSDDVIVGGTADQTLNGGNGNDIVWGRGGVDHIDGGSGGDFLRGGAGNDFLRGGSGDDLIDGGDVNLNQSDDGVDTAQFDDGSGGEISLASQGASSSGPQFLLVTRGTEVDTLHSIEKLVLSDGANTLKISADTDLRQLQEIDADSNPDGTRDILDLSALDGSFNVIDGKLVGTDVNIQLHNFEEVIGSSSNDTIDLDGSSAATLLGGEGNDTLIAGNGGDILDGGQSYGSLFDGGGNQYVGGAGADTFVIGNGTDAMNGSAAAFIISNAGADDRLVLRLADAMGFADPGNWTHGIVLNGGVQTVGPGGSDPDQVYADFSSILVRPQTIDTNSDGAWLTETSLDAVRPELGYFTVGYQWYKLESLLFVSVTSAYGDFNIRVDGFENGQLGLNFVDVSQPKLSAFHGSDSTNEILESWTPYNNALQSFVDNTQIVDLPSPGTPIDGDADPVTPLADIYWTPYPNYGDDAMMEIAAAPLGAPNLDSQMSQLAQAMPTHPAAIGFDYAGDDSGHSPFNASKDQISFGSAMAFNRSAMDINWPVDKFAFANGDGWNLQATNANAWYTDTSANDTVSGSSWNDAIIGGAGDYAMAAGTGVDTFVFRAAIGKNTDFAASQDFFEFRDGIDAGAAAAFGAATALGNDSIIAIDTAISVLPQNVALANLYVGGFDIV